MTRNETATDEAEGRPECRAGFVVPALRQADPVSGADGDSVRRGAGLRGHSRPGY